MSRCHRGSGIRFVNCRQPSGHRLNEASALCRSQSRTHRLNVTRAAYEPDPTGEGTQRIRMRTVMMINQAEFGDMELLFDLDASGTVTVYV